MARTRRNFDDDDDENFETTPNGIRILRDGGRTRVSMMDSRTARAQHLHDGRGGTPGRRPGYAFNRDTYAKDELEIAYDEYEKRMCDAWRNPIEEVADDRAYAEQMLIADAAAHNNRTAPRDMCTVYDAYDEAVRTAWKKPR